MITFPYFSAGDLDFFWKEQIQAFSWFPQVFHPEQGFGRSVLESLWLSFPIQTFLKLTTLAGLSWFYTEKILWVAALVSGIFSSYKLAKYVLGPSRWSKLTPIIYTVNTYFLLLFSGGQLGVALAYGFAPYVLRRFMMAIDESSRSFRTSVIIGFCLAVLITLDLRFAYMVLIIVGIYMMFHITRYQLLCNFAVPLLVSACFHLFWILPVLLAGGGINSVGTQYSNPGMLKFLSVADFSHAIGFLHPNWPENLFGKVYFLQPEFLIIPLLAFLSLMFIKKASKQTHQIAFFTLIVLLGAFMSKGVNDPFGGIFSWMFSHVPGFIMFRDPTKFYLLSAIGYAILIPYTLEHIFKRKVLKIITAVLFVLFWCFTIRSVFEGQVTGNFRPLRLTREYVQLKNFLIADNTPSRTLWIPQPDKFAFSSAVHPLLSADQLFPGASISAIISEIDSAGFVKTVRESGVGYIIVPADLEKKMFLTDYKFDRQLKIRLIEAFHGSSFREINGFGGLNIFRIDHDAMTIRLPERIIKQQYWATIGFLLDAAAFAGFVVYIIVKKK